MENFLSCNFNVFFALLSCNFIAFFCVCGGGVDANVIIFDQTLTFLVRSHNVVMPIKILIYTKYKLLLQKIKTKTAHLGTVSTLIIVRALYRFQMFLPQTTFSKSCRFCLPSNKHNTNSDENLSGWYFKNVKRQSLTEKLTHFVPNPLMLYNFVNHLFPPISYRHRNAITIVSTTWRGARWKRSHVVEHYSRFIIPRHFLYLDQCVSL